MPRRLPSLTALKTFEAAARHLSFARAAEELFLTPSAVSHQIKSLEQQLAVSLFKRHGRKIELSDAGARYYPVLRQSFDAMAEATAKLEEVASVGALTLSVVPTFAVRWLIPHLSDFQDKHPEIELRLMTHFQIVSFDDTDVDAAIRFGQGNWPGLQSEPLLISPIIVAAAPALIRGLRIDVPADLSNLPWLEELGTTEAGNWLRSKGVEQGIAGGRLQLPGNLLAGALREGQGVGVMVRHFAEPDLRSGHLVELFCEADEAAGYHIVTRPGPLRPEAKTFVSWLRRHRSV